MAEEITTVATDLVGKVKKKFYENIEKDKELSSSLKAIKSGSNHYTDAMNYSDRVGQCLRNAIDDVLPADHDATLDKEIAEQLVKEVYGDAYDKAVDVSKESLKNINKDENIGINPPDPEGKESRLNDLTDTVADEPLNEAKKKLLDAADNLPQGASSDTLRANAKMQKDAGLNPVIKRIYNRSGRECQYCAGLQGTFPYPVKDTDVYRRHKHCRCSVEYYPGKGKKYQDVWSKQWNDSAKNDRIKANNEFNLDRHPSIKYPINPDTGERYIDHEITIADSQFGKKIGKHAHEWGLSETKAEDRDKMRSIIQNIVNNADERVIGTWRGYDDPVIFHIKGADVVVESTDGNFITILKGGINTARIKKSRG